MASRCIFSCSHRDTRRHSLRYLRLALGRRPSARDRFRHLLYFATCVHDRVYLIDEQYECFHITIEGEPLVRAQLDAGHGAFLMGAHMGSFEMMRSVGRRQPALRVSMAMYEHNARKINAMLAAINPARCARHHCRSAKSMPCCRSRERLDRGAFVGMLGDRTLGDEPVQPVRLLGEPRLLADGAHARGGDSAPLGDLHGWACTAAAIIITWYSRRLRIFPRLPPARAMPR